MKTPDRVADLIASIPLFKGLSPDLIENLRQIGIIRHLDKERFIFFEGDSEEGFYVTVTGRVKIFKVSSDGKEQILHIIGPMESFAELQVFSGRPCPVSAQAIDKCELIFFPKPPFVDLVAANPLLALNMLAAISFRLRQCVVQIENLSFKDISSRLASYLLSLSEGERPTDMVTLNIPKRQLAGILGTIPATLSRIFSKMTEQGLIRVRGRRITFLNREKVEALAEHGKVF